MPRDKEYKPRFLLLLLSLLVGLLLSEGLVRLTRPASDIFPADPPADPILGIRLLPFQSGHDAKGFRNRTAEEYFPIVIIGDSMIYGVGVTRNHAIPQQLSGLLNQPVYNMGLGSYGPVQYYQLLINSRQMYPQKTVIAFFLGNDLLDAVYMVTHKPNWEKLGQDLGGGQQLAAITPCALPPGDQTAKYEYTDPQTITIKLKKSGSLLWETHAFLRLHSGLYSLTYLGLVKPLMERFFERRSHLERPGVFYTPLVDTIFTPGVNLSSMDPQDSQVRLGLLVTEKVVRMMAQLQKSPQDRENLWFFIVPSKENVYYNKLTSRQVILPSSSECAVHYERQITAWLKRIITANGFRFVDVLPALQLAADQGVLLYYASSDAHPNSTGNRIIAQTLADALKQ